MFSLKEKRHINQVNRSWPEGTTLILQKSPKHSSTVSHFLELASRDHPVLFERRKGKPSCQTPGNYIVIIQKHNVRDKICIARLQSVSKSSQSNNSFKLSQQEDMSFHYLQVLFHPKQLFCNRWIIVYNLSEDFIILFLGL